MVRKKPPPLRTRGSSPASNVINTTSTTAPTNIPYVYPIGVTLSQYSTVGTGMFMRDFYPEVPRYGEAAGRLFKLADKLQKAREHKTDQAVLDDLEKLEAEIEKLLAERIPCEHKVDPSYFRWPTLHQQGQDPNIRCESCGARGWWANKESEPMWDTTGMGAVHWKIARRMLDSAGK